MLYERWKIISAARRDETALRDFASGRRWTFGELFSEGEKVTPDSGPVCSGKIIFPQGHSPEFIFQLLAAWRETKIACPLETGQGGASVLASRFDSSHQVRLAGTLAPPIVHFKTTSATTGDSRLVAFTAEQLAADAENIVATMGLRADRPNLGVISLAHSYGFSNLILPLLLHGIPLVLAPAPLPEIVRRAAETEKFLTLAAVPAMWRAWHEAKAIPKNVRLAISAGAPLPLKLEMEIYETCGLKIHNFLGASECGGIAYDATNLPRTDATFVGAPMRNVNLSLRENCLRVQSNAVGETYWPEKSKALGGGIFQTSDLAELKDGKVFLRGRSGDQINVAGRKISPETIERALLANPKVRDCLVFGAASFDAERTEIIIAVVVSDAKENELKQFLLQTIPAWQVPREWKFVKSLSANARGKISRAEWRGTFVRAQT
jgi:acyl-coenzyme A synthetase/AMP-(fatty) acid ligase